MKPFRQQRRPKKSSLVIGRENIQKAIESGTDLDRIYAGKNLPGRKLEEIKTLARKHGIPLSVVPIQKLHSFNAGDHEGVVARIASVHYYGLQEIISFTVDKGETPLLLLLDGITDIRNIGAIARTAYCCGAHALVIGDKGVGALHEDAMLTSAGALEKIAVCRVNSLVKAVDELHLNGVRVFASDARSGVNVFDCDFRQPCAVVMGSEEKGIQPVMLKAADQKFKIPMSGDFESLNVSVATGMILYEVMRQRIGYN